MSATVDVQEVNGVTPDWSTVTSIRLCSTDTYNPSTSYKLTIPDTGTKRSFWKSIALNFSGTFTKVSNLKVYTDGSGFGTGITLYVGDETLSDGAYEQATGVVGDDGDEMTANHSGVSGKTDLFSFTSGSEMIIDSGEISSPGRMKHVVLQLDVASTATAATLSAETITFVYDEI